MELVTPGLGLLFWQAITFLVVLFLLSKFAWKPIMSALNAREASIDNALRMAERAKLEMQELKAGNEKLLAEARSERDKILKEAADASNQMIEAAKAKAGEESTRMIAQAREAVTNEKRAAIAEIKNLAGNLSVEIAEQLLKRELKDASAQQQLVNEYMKEVTLN